MELKNLEYLESVYRHRSFTKAANEHYISQPSISNAIQKLENELGTTLINRNMKPLVFTPDGERFMTHVYRILEACDNALKEMRHPAEDSKQIITLAWASTLGDVIRPMLFTDFALKYPDYQIDFSEATYQKMLDSLLEERLELAYSLIPDTWNPDLFEIIPIQMCEVYACMSPQHAFASLEKISLFELNKEKIMMFPSGSQLRMKIEEKLNELHIKPNFYTISALDVIQQLLLQNKGVALLAIDSFNSFSKDSELVLRPLHDPLFLMKGFILKRGLPRTEPVKNLIAYVQELVHSRLSSD